ncbi:succinate dehydrogenase/fumarate reductase iron-sulfur subunit [Afifella sp. IM 167]|uniref:succinate dehydrogenase/fumarate reductase iron-sulfur subunit n=1 Tax=Afifella sp. IM 167 TaxID=2033586 RepID=UPI001CCABCAB|nr:2Fe-2S iron-sulfur cluster-binding protein [Afifella sp. IM 167]MBZ8134283.1 succinate dehydrogenase/fumarate reductase iron-sulfur subunit [Afifella sp. IM 167]
MDAVSPKSLSVRIWRGKDDGRFETYEVPARDNQTVLDVVTEVQRRHEPALAYRFACRVGVCGSCAMTVNGVPRWTCRTHVAKVAEAGEITIEPLRNMPRIKDLACDMAGFFDKWQKAGGRFTGTRNRAEPPAAVDPASRKRVAVDAAIECINCAVCYSACDVVSWNEEYLGPAALNRAWTLVNDERHALRRTTLDLAMEQGGCGNCHTQGSCMRHCPVGISPTESIAGLKRMSLLSFLVRDHAAADALAKTEEPA